jgi:hypothetical protein
MKDGGPLSSLPKQPASVSGSSTIATALADIPKCNSSQIFNVPPAGTPRAAF